MGVLACVLKDAEQPPWLLPSRCQGQPLLNCNDPNSRRFQKYSWSGGYQNHCSLRTTDLDDPEVNAPHKQGSLTSLRVTCPCATAIAHIWEVCVASTTENPLVNPRGQWRGGCACPGRRLCLGGFVQWEDKLVRHPGVSASLTLCPGESLRARWGNQSRKLGQRYRFPLWPPSIALLFIISSGPWLKNFFFFCFYLVATGYFCVSKNLKRRLNLNTSFPLNSQFRREQLTASCSVKLLLSGLKIQLIESSNLPPVWIFLYHKADNDCTACHIGSPWLPLAEFFTLTIPGPINACYTNKSPGFAQDGMIINCQIFVPSRI